MSEKNATEAKTENAFSEGLEDIIAAESSICLIDGKNSRLAYRGIDIHELASQSTFEETTFLLHYGHLPAQQELEAFEQSIAVERNIPQEVIRLMQAFPKTANPMAVLRSAVSILAFFDSESEVMSTDANRRKAARLIAKMPTLVAAFERIRKGLAVIEPKTDRVWSAARNFLWMMRGAEPSSLETKMLDKYFILLAEHDLNASTFAARVTASTLSDMYSAISAAVGTLKGDLHGSANTRTMETLLAIGDISKVDAFVEEGVKNKTKFMGFGHRMYKGPDPRAKDLREMARMLAESNAEQAKWFAISEKLEKAVYEKKKLNCNVDFFSATVLYTLGVPVDLFTTLFAISRTAGWSAHVLEQYSHNRLIRPASLYTGLSKQTYIPISNRKSV